MNRALMRIAHEILERNRGAENVLLVGVRRRGEPIARRIAANIRASRAGRCWWAASTSASIGTI